MKNLLSIFREKSREITAKAIEFIKKRFKYLCLLILGLFVTCISLPSIEIKLDWQASESILIRSDLTNAQIPSTIRIKTFDLKISNKNPRCIQYLSFKKDDPINSYFGPAFENESVEMFDEIVRYTLQKSGDILIRDIPWNIPVNSLESSLISNKFNMVCDGKLSFDETESKLEISTNRHFDKKTFVLQFFASIIFSMFLINGAIEFSKHKDLN